MSRALCNFTVRHKAIQLKVKVLPHAKDVYTKLTGKSKWRKRHELPEGFFQEGSRKSKRLGLIVLAGNSDLFEIVPHEVFHAVMCKHKQLKASKDESAAYAIGILSAKILTKVLARIKQK